MDKKLYEDQKFIDFINELRILLEENNFKILFPFSDSDNDDFQLGVANVAEDLYKKFILKD